jgi:lipopolysaccharide assembly protein A
MRFLCFVILVALVIGVGIFAMQNNEMVTLRFYDWSLSSSMALLIAAVYVLGMLSGWTVIGFLRRSVHRVTDAR